MRVSCSFSTCSVSAATDSTSGTPARTSVASCRVITLTSRALGRLKNANGSNFFCSRRTRSASIVACVSRMPSRRNAARSVFGFSASRKPLTALPLPTSTPRNSKTATLHALSQNRWSVIEHHVVLRRRNDFFDGGVTVEHLAGSVVAQRIHALRLRRALDRARVGVVEHEPPDHVLDHEHLVNTEAARETFVVALVATLRPIKNRRVRLAPTGRLVLHAVRYVTRRQLALVAL